MYSTHYGQVKFREQDFEDISIYEPAKPRRLSNGSLGIDTHSPSSSVSSTDDHLSNLSTPTLTSDVSSLRSSLSSISSPALLGNVGPFTSRPSSQVAPHGAGMLGSVGASGLAIDSTNTSSSTINVRKTRADARVDRADRIERGDRADRADGPPNHGLNRRSTMPNLGQLPDNTSMASLSRLPSFRRNSRKQREQEYENDDGEDFWPGDGLMFNVPMSPALYAQQRNKSMSSLKSAPSGSSGSSGSGSTSHGSSGSTASTGRRASAPVVKAPKPRSSRRRSNVRQSSVSLPCIEESSAVEAADRRRSPNNSQPQPSSSSFSDSDSDMDPLGDASLEGLDADARDLTLAYSSDKALDFTPTRKSSASSSKSPSATSTPPPLMAGSRSGSQSGSRSASCDRSTAASDVSSASSSRRVSLTRPDHLPPKNEQEERRHLKEYERLLAKVAAADRKRQAEQERREQSRLQQQQSDDLAWSRWLAKAAKSPSTAPPSSLRPLRWRGISSKLRGSVWTARAGNALGVTFNPAGPLGGDAAEIVADSEHIYPELGIFGAHRPLNDSLVLLVRAFLGLHPALSYQRGLGCIAATLLLNLDEPAAFVVLANLVVPESLPYAALSGDGQTTHANYVSFGKVFRAKFGRLSEHFQAIRLPAQQYLDPMMASLMGEMLSPDSAAHIIDIYLFEGDAFLLRAALGIVRHREARLYQSRSDAVAELLARVSSDESLFRCIKDITRT